MNVNQDILIATNKLKLYKSIKIKQDKLNNNKRI